MDRRLPPGVPPLTEVYSSRVAAIGHDPVTNSLYVRWRRGKISRYDGVPPAVAERVSKAWSVGEALNEHVVGKFDHGYVGKTE